jgi:hypothetical protein
MQMYEGTQSHSESYAAFDVSEWVATDDGREPATVHGSSAGETLDVTAAPNTMAYGLQAAKRFVAEREESKRS